MSCTGHLAAPEDLFNCFPVFQTCHAECCSFQQHASPPPSLRMLYRCWQRARCPANGATSEFSPRRVSYSIPLSNFLVFSRPFVVLPSHRDSHFLRHQPRRGGYEKAGLQSVSSYLNGQRTRSAPGYHWVQGVIGPKRDMDPILAQQRQAKSCPNRPTNFQKRLCARQQIANPDTKGPLK